MVVRPVVGGVLAPGALSCLAGTSAACTRCAAGEAASTGASAQELARSKPGQCIAWYARKTRSSTERE